MTTVTKEFTEEVNKKVKELSKTFMSNLVSWHKEKVAMLEHLQTIPKETGIEIHAENGEVGHLMFNDDLHKGFVLGLSVAIAELGTHPFDDGKITLLEEQPDDFSDSFEQSHTTH